MGPLPPYVDVRTPLWTESPPRAIPDTAHGIYTSRTRSWDGFVDRKLGGAKTVSDGSIVVDRDMNGARGIMLRALYGNLGRFQAAGAEVALVAE